MLEGTEQDEAFLYLAEAAVGEALDESGMPPFTPSGVSAAQIDCFSEILLNIQRRQRLSDDAVLNYVAGKLYWSWKHDLLPVQFTPADALRAGGDLQFIRRVAMVGEPDLWTTVVASDPELVMNPTARLLRQFPLGEQGVAGVLGMNESRDDPDVPDAAWDVFICHASEDKDAIARPLADALSGQGLRVWYDEFSLKLGDSLRRTIDRGLAGSRYGVVILSRSFFQKQWPQRELDGLTALEMDGKKVVLPIWHGIDRNDVLRYSPTLADRVATTTEDLERVVEAVLDVVKKDT